VVIGNPGLRKALATRWRTQTATIRRGTLTPDGYGGQTIPDWPAGWATVATYPARYEATGQEPDDTVIASRLAGSVPYLVYLPPLATVLVDDRIQLDGHTFEVIGLRDQTDESNRLAVCREVL
jgi:hypothetical protein